MLFLLIDNIFQIKTNKMKKNQGMVYSYILTFALCCMQLMVGAQDSTSTSRSTTITTETTTTNDWYMQPWVWIVGGAVLLIILVALLRGNSNKEVSKTTVIKDDRGYR